MIPARAIGNDFSQAIESALRAVVATGLAHAFWHDDREHAYLTTPAVNGDCDVSIAVCQEGSIVILPTDDVAAARKRYLDLHYVGAEGLPKWVADGIFLRVKATADLRKHGFSTTQGGHRSDDRAWPGEIGIVHRREGNGWWTWQVEFERGRVRDLSPDNLLQLVRVKK